MKFRSTTILTVRRNGIVAMGGDGQVSLGQTVMKGDACKVRPLAEGRVLAGFAGAAADAFALLERFEEKLRDHPSNMPRAATELAKEWRTDRALRRLEALIAVADTKDTLFDFGHRRCHSARRRHPGHRLGRQTTPCPLHAHCPENTDLSAIEIVRKGLTIAADICVYTNHHITVENLECTT